MSSTRNRQTPEPMEIGDLIEFSPASSRGGKKSPEPLEDLIEFSPVSSGGKQKNSETKEGVYDLYIGRTNRQDQPELWVLMLVMPGEDRCTFYHSSRKWHGWPE
ncbi:hypothetical protein BJY01DRAFT_245098 [Aspergillus pseudoustus]|uniref:Uncharacterized protein n=1 Tax=Aspergillus pseudoustus TaxID=1810923 RepID=A0ABR4KFW3_9EURO